MRFSLSNYMILFIIIIRDFDYYGYYDFRPFSCNYAE